MPAELLIVLPVLGRPRRARPVLDSIRAATDVDYRVLFVCSTGDRRQIHACRSLRGALRLADLLVAPWQPGPGDWAKKVNLAYRSSDEPFLFLGADDLNFRPGWAAPAVNLARLGYGVVGTNDLGNPRVKAGRHSTHSVVSRRYADERGTVDGPGEIVHEGYDHQYADDELVGTAKARGEWAFCGDSIVEHLHPYFGKAQMDATYEKALRETRADGRLYRARRGLWERR